MADKNVEDLVESFERAYKYYKGWLFEYIYPGFFVYHQMGGPLSVFFTPDWSRRGEVDIQVQSEEGQLVEGEGVPYVHPETNGVPYGQAEAFALFRIVRPWLEKHGSW